MPDAAATFPGFSRDTFDDALINPEVVANTPEMMERFADLRRDDPVHWTEPQGFRPFWSLTRHADILAVSKDNARFINRERTYLTPIPAEQDILAKTGDTHLFRTLVDLDDPEHMKLRKLTHDWFLPANLRKLEPRIREIARAHIDRMAALGGACDFVSEVALWYPLRVIMMLLGIPESDEPMMLKMTQEIFGAGDPDVVARSNRLTSGGGAEPGREQVDLVALAQAFFAYFAAVTADRRAHPKDDVATVIANGLIDGEPIGDLQAMSYYVIIATAGHDTTSSTAAGGLFHLIRNPGEMAKLKADPSLIPLFVEEAIRWATPVKHFMRTAAEDVELGGKTIHKGEHLALFYWSGNFDEAVFDEPYAFRADRKPNPHIAFGNGVHICLGLHLARLELRILFEELLPRLESIELAGDPANSRSNFVSGLKTLPVRYRLA